MNTDRELLGHAAHLLSSAELDGPFELRGLAGGRNNRVFRVEGRAFRALLKVYFRHPADPRDRLGTEYRFSSFAWSRGIRAIPQPLACDPDRGLGLYEFLDGRRLTPEELSRARISELMEFFLALNRHRHAADARALPRASDSCISLAEQFHSVDRRLDRLRRMRPSSLLEHEASSFVEDELVPAWRRTRLEAEERALERRMAFDRALDVSALCLSPSDFGFHNALATRAGKMAFVDFEYAGWDDPAKMVCDLFCQPEIPLADAYLPWVAASVCESLPDSARVYERIGLYMPICRIRWACLFMNEFLPVEAIRREFSGSLEKREERMAEQLQLARRYVLASEEKIPHGIH